MAWDVGPVIVSGSLNAMSVESDSVSDESGGFDDYGLYGGGTALA